MYLENIDGPADVKRLNGLELETLCAELRAALLHKLSRHGGHCGPNLGIVEATVALHYVFDSPTDKLVFDVSHQTYIHKMLTGRRAAFVDESRFDEVSGYSEPAESPHDHFIIGHTSTSVSLAAGLAKGRDLAGGTWNVVAVIGDGSLSGGEAFEGLNHAAELGTNFIVVVNDNEMSIAENHGGLYQNLATLRQTDGRAQCNYFRALGFDYRYVADGNDVTALIEAFRMVKNTPRPVVVHIHTQKGMGYAPAMAARELWHFHAPFDPATGADLWPDEGDDYNDLTARLLLTHIKDDPTVVAITAGTPSALGFTPERRKEAGAQFVDVGIAEEHAVALASGIARAGGRPVFGVFSTFVQRAYDQISQDLCINGSPATLLVFWGSLATMNDVTHLCHFDIPLLSGIPNLTYLAPTNSDEYAAMLAWSLRQDAGPVAIRVPAVAPAPAVRPVATDYGGAARYEVVRRGTEVAILALGNFFALGESVCRLLEADGIHATLINPRYISALDEETLDALRTDHSIVVTLEDGVIDGGWGEKVARHYGPTPMRVFCYGARKGFPDRYDLNDLLRANRLVDTMIADEILKELGVRS